MTDETRQSAAMPRLRAPGAPLAGARRRLALAGLLMAAACAAWAGAEAQPVAAQTVTLEQEYNQALQRYMAESGGRHTVLVALTQKNGKGDIYNGVFMGTLEYFVNQMFYVPGIDRGSISSLFSHGVSYKESTPRGPVEENIVPSDYMPSAQMFARVRSNVQKSEHVGRYTNRSQTGAMIYAEVLERHPLTGEKLDLAEISFMLEHGIRARLASPKKYVYRLKEDSDDFDAGHVLDERFIPLTREQMATIYFDVPRGRGFNPDPVKIKADLATVEEVANPDYNPGMDVYITRLRRAKS